MKKEITSEEVAKTTEKVYKKPTMTSTIKVVDFTVWKGFKFGFGFMGGVTAFSIILGILAFLFNAFLIGFFAMIRMPNL
jgi:hypothetical protein